MPILTKTFNASIYACKDGSVTPAPAIENLKKLHTALVLFWDSIGSDWTVDVVSGYRSKEYNKRIGGAKASRHVIGDAADIKVYKSVTNSKNAVAREHMAPSQVKLKWAALQAKGLIPKGGIGLYPSFTHVDTRGFHARWSGSRTDY